MCGSSPDPAPPPPQPKFKEPKAAVEARKRREAEAEAEQREVAARSKGRRSLFSARSGSTGTDESGEGDFDHIPNLF